jgi:uncharacterized protein
MAWERGWVGAASWRSEGTATRQRRTAGFTGDMATRLLMMADTHIPTKARALPVELWAAIEAADAVFHAGDWVDVRLVDELESKARRLIAVCGNNDHGPLRERLPVEATADVEGLRFGVVHETGPAAGREGRCSRRYPDLDVLVFGHSHIPWDTSAPTGLRLLNPGSPTDRRRQPHGTYLTATAHLGALRHVTLRPLPAGTRPRR